MKAGPEFARLPCRIPRQCRTACPVWQSRTAPRFPRAAQRAELVRVRVRMELVRVKRVWLAAKQQKLQMERRLRHLAAPVRPAAVHPSPAQLAFRKLVPRMLARALTGWRHWLKAGCLLLKYGQLHYGLRARQCRFLAVKLRWCFAVLARPVRLGPDRRGWALRCPEPRSQWKAPCLPANLPAPRCLSGRTPSAGQPFSPALQAFAGKLALRQPRPQPSDQRIAAPHALGKSPASPKSCQKMLHHWMRGILLKAFFHSIAPTAPTAPVGPAGPTAKMAGSIHGQACAARFRQGHPQHCLKDLPKQPRQSGSLQ